MQLTRKIAADTFYVGGSDRRLELFENIYPIERGVSYNSYLVMDDKTVLLDTVDHSISRQFMENIDHILGENGTLDYVIVNHVEPDHCATLGDIIQKYPNVKIVGNAKTHQFIQQFYSFDESKYAITVKEGDTLCTGNHTFAFVLAPMVHWPEVMVTFDTSTKTLYSADAFGTFGALSGSLWADDYDFEGEWLEDARRYFTNIVGKYGMQTMNVLKKAATLDIKMIAPLHGPIWRKNIGWFIDKYKTWATYSEEAPGVLVVYASIYGNTETAAMYTAMQLGDRGVKNIHMYDASKTDVSILLSECFKYSKVVFAAPTYNLELFPKMETLMLELKAHNWQNRKVGLIENGTWAIQAGKKMREYLSSMKNIEIANDNCVTIRSSAKDAEARALEALAEEMAK